jgi:hypothetical protein
VVLQSEIRRPDASDYEGGYEHVEGYAAAPAAEGYAAPRPGARVS